MTIDSVYNSKILEFAGNIPHIGRLESPDGSAKAHSKLCGSTVIVDVNVKEGRISDYAHDVKACALGQAAASILASHVIGSELSELEELRDQMTAMLKENGPAPEGKIADLQFLEPVREYRARHASTLLAFNAVVDAMHQPLGEGEREPKSKDVA